MKKETREKLYKISEVAEILGVHEDTLRNWEREGFVVPERIGKRQDRRYTAEMIGEIKKKGLVSDLAKKAPAQKKDLDEYTKGELIKELQLLKKQKKYGLVWEYHTEEVVERCKTEAPILVAKKDKQIKDKDKNKPTNILIEGDNYHALQVLNYTHKGKIDVIYIDPPYNTGNKDFVYNDHYVDKEDNFRHSKWLSFMEKRLVLAKKLLKKDGVIFISIDDNEQAQLKILCDGIFGERNHVNTFTWVNNLKGRQISNVGASKTYEYILCYSKDLNSVPIFTGKSSLLRISMPDVYKIKNYDVQKDEHGEYVIKNELYNTNSFFNEETRPNLVYNIFYNEKDNAVIFSKVDENINEKGFIKITPKKNNNGTHKYHAWRWGQDKIKREIHNLLFIKNKNTYKIYSKIRDIDRTNLKDIIIGYPTSSGGSLLQDILNKKVFDYPKPLELIKFLLNQDYCKDASVLDFMAGSGTTGHAVLDLNKEDGGNRKFILCTNNENQICEKVTHERIKRVIKGYTKLNGEKVKGLGGSLEYFKTEFVDVENIDKISDKKKLEFTYEAGQMIALKEDAFKEVVKNKFYQIFTDEKDKFVGIYFRENLDKLAEMEKKILDKKDVKLYLFSYGVNDFKKDYTEYKNVTVKDIPEPILKIYKRLNN